MMTFGEALEQVKQGKMIARSGWNGKGMFVFQRPADTLSIEVIEKVKSMPAEVKVVLLSKGKAVEFTSYLCMYSAQGQIVNGWLASQSDMLAEDWQTL